jgi:hypothetical protein
MYVNIDLTATSGCHISSNVYRATGPCTGLTQLSCLAGAPLDDMHPLTGLTVGGLYYIQVCYSPGGPCGNNGSAQYCVNVGIPDPPCATCSTPCGDAYGYTSAPTVAQVVANCISTPFHPPLQPGTPQTFCNTFTATNTNVSFNVVITSDCGTGNVTNFSWALYNFPSCGGTIQTGTLASLNFTGLTVGNSYVFCYTFTVPAGCTHTQHCPYFVGATVPLPVTWLEFTVEGTEQGWADLHWTTGSEINSDHYTVERSRDGEQFVDLGDVAAIGLSSTPTSYAFLDKEPHPGINYYRIRQTDMDGSTSFTPVKSVVIAIGLGDALVIPNPTSGDANLSFTSYSEDKVDIAIHDAFGRVVHEQMAQGHTGYNSQLIRTSELAQGVYSITLGNIDRQLTVRFIRE